MLTRRSLLVLTGLSLFSATVAVGEGQKKRKKDRSGPVGAQDGKNDVKGATWQLNADLVGGKKKEQFNFRVQDGVIFDRQGMKAGVVSPLGNTKDGGKKSKMVLRESFPLKGEIILTQTKHGVWNGVLKTKEGEEWTCRFEVLDR